MGRIRNIISYLQPLVVEVCQGELNTYLEVTLRNGNYNLNGTTVNYSYGGIHKLFDRFFGKVDIASFDFSSILLLGTGAGSVISLLREKYGIYSHITAVEADEVVLRLAHDYFYIDRFSNLDIVKSDAGDFCKEANGKFDLIIVDLFIDKDIPKRFMHRDFLMQLKKIATDNCCVVFNKMTELDYQKAELKKLHSNFESCFPGTELHKFNINGSENTILYYNCLSRVIKATELKAQETYLSGLVNS